MTTKDKPTDDSEMESTEEEEPVKSGDILRNSGLHALTAKPDVMTAILSPAIKRRILALKNLQLSVTKLDAEFYMEVHALEVKYMRLYYPFLDKRADIVNGRYEPNDEECQWESETDDQSITETLQQTKIEDKANEKKEDAKGIPGFWLTIFKNVSMLSDMVQEHDEPILECLEDIKVIMLEKDPMGFVLEFHFGPNEYFSNSVLTKEYNMKCHPDQDHPFDFEGPEIYKCVGCPIMWCKDKNVTVKTIKKRQKHKSRGSVRTIVKTVPTDSFFNFFDPPNLPSDPTADVAEHIQTLLTSDFEIGHYFRERVVPFAVLLYTGEGLDEEEDFEEDEEDECESEEEESSECEEAVGKKNVAARRRGGGVGGRVGGRGPRHPSTNDESNDDENRDAKGGRKGGNRAAGGKGRNPAGGPQQNQPNPAECKQQ